MNIKQAIKILLESTQRSAFIEYSPRTDKFTIRAKDNNEILFHGNDDDARIFIHQHGVTSNDSVIGVLKMADGDYTGAVNLKRLKKDSDAVDVNREIGALRRLDSDGNPIYFKTIFITQPDIQPDQSIKTTPQKKEEPASSLIKPIKLPQKISPELANELVFNTQIRNTIAALLQMYKYESWPVEEQKEKVKQELLLLNTTELLNKINDVVKTAVSRYDFIKDPKVTWRTNLSGAKQAILLIKNSMQKNEAVKYQIRKLILGEEYVKQYYSLLKEAKKDEDFDIGSPEWVTKIMAQADEYYSKAKVIPDEEDLIGYILDAVNEDAPFDIDYKTAKSYYDKWVRAKRKGLKEATTAEPNWLEGIIETGGIEDLKKNLSPEDYKALNDAVFQLDGIVDHTNYNPYRLFDNYSPLTFGWKALDYLVAYSKGFIKSKYSVGKEDKLNKIYSIIIDSRKKYNNKRKGLKEALTQPLGFDDWCSINDFPPNTAEAHKAYEQYVDNWKQTHESDNESTTNEGLKTIPVTILEAQTNSNPDVTIYVENKKISDTIIFYFRHK